VIGSEEVYAAKSPLSRESPVDPETATPCDTSVLDIVLVLGHVDIHDKVMRRLHVGFRFAFRNSMLIRLLPCAPPSSGLLFHV
jgi:hypothetical protein